MVEEVTAREAWAALAADEAARLVDVRTPSEWRMVGIPDLGEVGKEVILIPWQSAPSAAPSARFVEGLRAAGLGPAQPVYFICRSGVRSLAAARRAAEAGFGPVFNVARGYEAEAGWRAEALPAKVWDEA